MAIEKVCKNCTKLFLADRHRTLFCSQKCFGMNNRPIGTTPWNKGVKTGVKPPNYRGDAVSYSGLHHWVRYYRGTAKNYQCTNCIEPAKEWANISGEYRRELEDWQPMCVRCHRNMDDVGNKAWVTRTMNGTRQWH